MNSKPSLYFQSVIDLSAGQASSAGIKAVNEDAIGIHIPTTSSLTTKGVVALIADGVSTSEAGKEASETCITSFLSDYYSTPDSWTVKKSAQKVLTALNCWLFSQGQRFEDARKGYITTLSVIVFKSNIAHIFHVGDSRIYLLRGDNFKQITRDHALEFSNKQFCLTRAMGLDSNLYVDYQTVQLQVGDVFLLSTDGIHNFISNQCLKNNIEQCIGTSIENRSKNLEKSCFKLINTALENDSNDNLSCQIICINHLPKQEVDEAVARLTTLPFPPFLKAGMILDGYKIIQEIHASNRSQIYLIKDINNAHHYCLKTPSVNFEDDPAYIERFVMESWIGSRINNKHVVNIVEDNREKSCLYYLMEYIEGMTLRQWIKEHPKPPIGEVVTIIEDIAKGLQAFHRKETLHQDIKPDNIIIDKNGVARIIDFGSCFVAGLAEIATPLEREIALGTANYSAPEYLLNTTPVYQADLFSLASICYEMLTGKLPFNGKLQLCKKEKDFLSLKYIPSYQLNPLVPVWIDGALRKALRYNPQLRQQAISEFVHEIQHPNNHYLETRFQPLLEKDPLKFWQCLVGILVVTQLVSICFIHFLLNGQ